MNYIDADNKQIFVGAAIALIPFNAILRRDRTMEEKNWGVECRLRTRRLDAVIEMLLRLGAAIISNNKVWLASYPQSQKGARV